MNTMVADQVASFTAVIEQAGVPALRVAFTVAVVLLAGVGLFIFHKRHQFFDRDPNVENDGLAVRHNRVEEVVFCLERLNAGFAQHSLPDLECMT